MEWAGHKQEIEARLTAYEALNRAYGDVLRMRLSSSMPFSFLLTLLANDVEHVLQFWEETCRVYLEVNLDPDEAVCKIAREIGGAWKTSQFDARLKDSFLELRVVADLSCRGYSKFYALSTSGTSTPDFGCEIFDGKLRQNGCLEVKNVREPIGITETFSQALEDLRREKSGLANIDIKIEHYWDNVANEGQREAIYEAVRTLSADGVSASTTLELTDSSDGPVMVDLHVSSGTGRVVLTRSHGGDYPIGASVRTNRLLNKVSETIDTAIKQLSFCRDSIKVLAINVEMPGGFFPAEIGGDIQQLVSQKSNEQVHCILFYHHRFLEI